MSAGIAVRFKLLIIFEDAGFDVILVESVGVGQSELLLADLVDVFTLIIAPGAGDELQVQGDLENH